MLEFSIIWIYTYNLIRNRTISKQLANVPTIGNMHNNQKFEILLVNFIYINTQF